MGIASVVNACSHIQNACRARLGLVSVPNTKYNLRLLLAMHRAGLISGLARGGLHPPTPDELLSTPAVSAAALVNGHLVNGKSASVCGPATSRIWLGLKYLDGEPVLKNLRSVSTSKRAITANLSELRTLSQGWRAAKMPGLALGECLFLNTDLGTMEAREAIEKGRGGVILCRTT